MNESNALQSSIFYNILFKIYLFIFKSSFGHVISREVSVPQIPTNQPKSSFDSTNLLSAIKLYSLNQY